MNENGRLLPRQERYWLICTEDAPAQAPRRLALTFLLHCAAVIPLGLIARYLAPEPLFWGVFSIGLGGIALSWLRMVRRVQAEIKRAWLEEAWAWKER